MKNPARNLDCVVQLLSKWLCVPIPSWVTHVPRKTALLFYLPWVCSLLLLLAPFFLFSPTPFSAAPFWVSMSLSYTHTCLYTFPHTQTDTRPDTHSGYLDPAAEASGDTKDTTGPRSGPSSHPELILHSQSPGQSLIPPPPANRLKKARFADAGLTRSLL